jgi:hypothetical protein|tara:strand:- start:1596 stop:1868 length:273 start_codon:yes stop_codon:yes gene_type:complete
MTFDQWIATEVITLHDKYDLPYAAEVMGYDEVPENWCGVAYYDPVGVMVKLNDGQWYTHVECEEYTGDFETVRNGLWNWAKHECGEEVTQ